MDSTELAKGGNGLQGLYGTSMGQEDFTVPDLLFIQA